MQCSDAKSYGITPVSFGASARSNDVRAAHDNSVGRSSLASLLYIAENIVRPKVPRCQRLLAAAAWFAVLIQMNTHFVGEWESRFEITVA